MTPRWCKADRGSVSTAIGVLTFMPLLALALGAMRIVQINGDVSSAAQFSARAATLAYQDFDARVEAERVAADSLMQRDITCQNFSAEIVSFEPRSTSGVIAPGASITVEVSCTVDLSQSLIAGFPGTKTVTATAVGKVDNIRGGGELAEP